MQVGTLFLQPLPFPDGLRLEENEVEATVMLCIVKVGHLCPLASASSSICLSVQMVMDIPLWNVGLHVADLISRTSGFCWEELLPPQSRTGRFSVLSDVGEDVSMFLC